MVLVKAQQCKFFCCKTLIIKLKNFNRNILTGIYVPTSGTALINGYDVRFEYDSIRKNIGICPQHDTLFEL